jgi:hypothetical protein
LPESVFEIQKKLTQVYIEDQKKYFVKEAGGAFLNNRTVQRILKVYLSTLFSLDAERFGDNMINFQAYQKYFSLPDVQDYKSDFVNADIDSAVKERTNDAWEKTKIFEWLKR